MSAAAAIITVLLRSPHCVPTVVHNISAGNRIINVSVLGPEHRYKSEDFFSDIINTDTMSGQQFPTTTPEDWAKSDKYHNSFLLQPDPVLEHAIENSQANGLPDIAVSAAQGKFLNLLARSIDAKRILEVGTLGGLEIYYIVIIVA